MKIIDGEHLYQVLRQNDLKYMQQADLMVCLKNLIDREPILPQLSRQSFKSVMHGLWQNVAYMDDIEYVVAALLEIWHIQPDAYPSGWTDSKTAETVRFMATEDLETTCLGSAVYLTDDEGNLITVKKWLDRCLKNRYREYPHQKLPENLCDKIFDILNAL